MLTLPAPPKDEDKGPTTACKKVLLYGKSFTTEAITLMPSGQEVILQQAYLFQDACRKYKLCCAPKQDPGRILCHMTTTMMIDDNNNSSVQHLYLPAYHTPEATHELLLCVIKQALVEVDIAPQNVLCHFHPASSQQPLLLHTELQKASAAANEGGGEEENTKRTKNKTTHTKKKGPGSSSSGSTDKQQTSAVTSS